MNWAQSTEYVFIYDISTGMPIKTQVVKVPNTYHGIVFDPSGMAFYVSNGMGDFPFDNNGNIITNPADIGTVPGDDVPYRLRSTLLPVNGWISPALALALNHQGMGLELMRLTAHYSRQHERVGVSPCAAGVAISKDGQTLVVANYYNDSITVFNRRLGNWSRQQLSTPPTLSTLRTGI